MKLYTEEQVMKFINDNFDEGCSELVGLTSMELPTDEEIEQVAKDKVNLSADCFGQYDFTSGKQDGFIDGAIWMRDKIKGGEQ